MTVRNVVTNLHLPESLITFGTEQLLREAMLPKAPGVQHGTEGPQGRDGINHGEAIALRRLYSLSGK